MANRGFDHGRLGHRHVYHHPNKTQSGPNKITVGGSENWHFGYNYTIWAIKHGSFYLNDILGEFCFHGYFILFFLAAKYKHGYHA